MNSTISTQYFYINCSRIYGVDGTINWPVKLGIADLSHYNNADVWLSETGNTDFVSQWLTHISTKYNDNWPESSKLDMLFASWSGTSIGSDAGTFHTANTTIAECTIEPSFVDIQMVCTGFSCHAAAARRSARVRPTNSSDWESNNAWWTTLLEKDSVVPRDFLTYWTLALSSPDSGEISPTLMYMGGFEAFPFTRQGLSFGGDAPVLYELKSEDFTRRMRRLFNTYGQGSIGPPAYNATIPQGEAEAFLSGKTATDSNSLYSMSISHADATFERDIIIYRTDPRWLAITIIASTILLLTGFIGFAASCG